MAYEVGEDKGTSRLLNARCSDSYRRLQASVMLKDTRQSAKDIVRREEKGETRKSEEWCHLQGTERLDVAHANPNRP